MREIIGHYDQVPEDDRLLTGWGQLEFARTQELILGRLPAPPGRILDVGGGSGIYAAWLASRGYETHLIDPVARHIARARRELPGIASAEVGDARSLAHTDASFDAVLLLGPLYHLTESADRAMALAEARRVLRPDGRLFAAAINHFGSLFDGLARGLIDDPRFAPILERDLRDGQHRNPTDNPDYFTTAFFHRPEELESEVAQAGFLIEQIAAVEGPVWLARDFEQRWRDPLRREQLLHLARTVQHERDLIGASPHLLAVARRPE
jgi:SAM-dependent methyltransferase